MKNEDFIKYMTDPISAIHEATDLHKDGEGLMGSCRFVSCIGTVGVAVTALVAISDYFFLRHAAHVLVFPSGLAIFFGCLFVLFLLRGRRTIKQAEDLHALGFTLLVIKCTEGFVAQDACSIVTKGIQAQRSWIGSLNCRGHELALKQLDVSDQWRSYGIGDTVQVVVDYFMERINELAGYVQKGRPVPADPTDSPAPDPKITDAASDASDDPVGGVAG